MGRYKAEQRAARESSSRRLQDNTTEDSEDGLLLPAGNLTDGLNSTQGSQRQSDRRYKAEQRAARESSSRRLQDNTTEESGDELLLPAGNLTDGLNATQGAKRN